MSLMEEKSLASGIASGRHKPQKGEAMKSQPDHKRITPLVVRMPDVQSNSSTSPNR